MSVCFARNLKGILARPGEGVGVIDWVTSYSSYDRPWRERAWAAERVWFKMGCRGMHLLLSAC